MSSLRPFRFAQFCLVFALISPFLLPHPCLAQKAKSGPVKSVGYSGDPARKRGMEIGYDKGLKAGKKDNEAKLKPDPSRHEIYKDPKKEYRYEYGSAASFNSGFKSGFLGGYKQAFGGNVKIKADGTSGSSGGSASTPGTPPTTTKASPKVKKATVTSDAL